MIDVFDSVLSTVRTAVPTAYRGWPQKVTRGKAPFAIVEMTSRDPVQTDRDGSEVIVRFAFAVSVFGSSPYAAETSMGGVIDGMAAINFHTSGYASLYEDASKLYRVNATFTGSVDRRGATFAS